MRICLAQTRPVKGDIQKNIQDHLKFIELALSRNTDLIVFPELSVTGYEPSLAKNLATNPSDGQFDVFQHLADDNQMIIGVGAPINDEGGIQIGTIFFRSNKPRQIYLKKFLHADENPFFIEGKESIILIGETKIAPAICYELSVSDHAKNASDNGAEVYLASVAKSPNGVKTANKTLSDLASGYAMHVLMVNCVGQSEGFENAGQSAVWSQKGQLISQLNATDEGILIFDTESKEVFKQNYI